MDTIEVANEEEGTINTKVRVKDWSGKVYECHGPEDDLYGKPDGHAGILFGLSEELHVPMERLFLMWKGQVLNPCLSLKDSGIMVTNDLNVIELHSVVMEDQRSGVVTTLETRPISGLVDRRSTTGGDLRRVGGTMKHVYPHSSQRRSLSL